MYRSALAAIASLVLSQGSPAMDLVTVTPQEPAFGYGYGGSPNGAASQHELTPP